MDNRKKLTELSSKAKTSFKIDTRDKKLFVGGSSDKKKRKREDEQEDKKEESSVPKRNKMIRKGDNLKETELRTSSSSSLLDKNKGGDKNEWELSATGGRLQAAIPVFEQVTGGKTKSIANFFESLHEHQRGPQMSMAIDCTVSQRPLTNCRGLTILDG